MQCEYNVHVIFHAVNAKQLATPAIQNAPDIAKQLLAAGLGECLASILRAENHLIQYLCVCAHGTKELRDSKSLCNVCGHAEA